MVARDGEDGLSETELLAFVSLLLVADNETTTNLIGNGTLALLRNPQQRRLLEERPELIDSAIEEFLRYEGPVQHPAQRVVMEPETFQGVDIPVGDRVVPILASADCDERQWDAPDQLDIERQPNKHVAFGDWIRICIGQYLARVEAKVAIPSLLRTLPEVELAIPEEEITYLPQFNLRGLERLPVRRTT